MDITTEDISKCLELAKQASKEFNTGNYPALEEFAEFAESKPEGVCNALAFLFHVVYTDLIKDKREG